MILIRYLYIICMCTYRIIFYCIILYDIVSHDISCYTIIIYSCAAAGEVPPGHDAIEWRVRRLHILYFTILYYIIL